MGYTEYDIQKMVSSSIKDLRYPQKYLKLMNILNGYSILSFSRL